MDHQFMVKDPSPFNIGSIDEDDIINDTFLNKTRSIGLHTM